MKPEKNQFAKASLCAALAFPAVAFSQQEPQWERGENYESTSDSLIENRLTRAEVRKVSEDEMGQRVTAERLLGTELKDRNGETIGTVEDLSVGDAIARADRPDNQELLLPPNPDLADVEVETDQDGDELTVAGATGYQPGDAKLRTPNINPATEPREPMAGVVPNQDAEQGDIQMQDARFSPGYTFPVSEFTLYVNRASDEGEELLEVPSSMVGFDPEEEVLTLNMTKDEFEALAGDSGYSQR